MLLRLLLAIFFLASFSIGIGFIAIPLVVGLAGFWPGILASFLVWLFSIGLGLLYLETALVFPDGANAMGFSRKLLDPFGRYLTGISFILLHYSLLVSYFFAVVPLISQLFDISILACATLTLLIVGAILAFGVPTTIAINTLLFLALAFIFFRTSYIDISHIQKNLIDRQSWLYIGFGIPTVFNAFYFQSLIPSLATFLKHNRFYLKMCIWTGTTLALIFFLTWITIAIGTFAGDYLLEAFETSPQKGYLQLNQIPHIGKGIAWTTFYALITSLLCAAVAFIDFFADLLHIPLSARKGAKRIGLIALILIPSIAVSFFHHADFIKFLNLIGGPIALITTGVLPLWWTFVFRHRAEIPNIPILRGSSLVWWILFFATLLMFYMEGLTLIHLSQW